MLVLLQWEKEMLVNLRERPILCWVSEWSVPQSQPCPATHPILQHGTKGTQDHMGTKKPTPTPEGR